MKINVKDQPNDPAKLKGKIERNTRAQSRRDRE